MVLSGWGLLFAPKFRTLFYSDAEMIEYSRSEIGQEKSNGFSFASIAAMTQGQVKHYLSALKLQVNKAERLLKVAVTNWNEAAGNGDRQPMVPAVHKEAGGGRAGSSSRLGGESRGAFIASPSKLSVHRLAVYDEVAALVADLTPIGADTTELDKERTLLNSSPRLDIPGIPASPIRARAYIPRMSAQSQTPPRHHMPAHSRSSSGASAFSSGNASDATSGRVRRNTLSTTAVHALIKSPPPDHPSPTQESAFVPILSATGTPVELTAGNAIGAATPAANASLPPRAPHRSDNLMPSPLSPSSSAAMFHLAVAPQLHVQPDGSLSRGDSDGRTSHPMLPAVEADREVAMLMMNSAVLRALADSADDAAATEPLPASTARRPSSRATTQR